MLKVKSFAKSKLCISTLSHTIFQAVPNSTKSLAHISTYSNVPIRRADRNKQAGLEKSATLLAYLLSKLINQQGGIFRLLNEKLRAGWKENLKNLSKHALLLGTSE